jgi:hypothetical protein
MKTTSPRKQEVIFLVSKAGRGEEKQDEPNPAMGTKDTRVTD